MCMLWWNKRESIFSYYHSAVESEIAKKIFVFTKFAQKTQLLQNFPAQRGKSMQLHSFRKSGLRVLLIGFTFDKELRSGLRILLSGFTFNIE